MDLKRGVITEFDEETGEWEIVDDSEETLDMLVDKISDDIDRVVDDAVRKYGESVDAE